MGPLTYLMWLDGEIDDTTLAEALSRPKRHIPTGHPWLLLIDTRGATGVVRGARAAVEEWLRAEAGELRAVAIVIESPEPIGLFPVELSRPRTKVFTSHHEAHSWLGSIARALW